MTMQLFSLGHPCEHQLRRACIGGNSCPLNGYPDAWCCSFIKGKIGFKRDKPCEGPRCRWGFTHPSQSQFEAVALVLNEARPIAAKIEEAEDKDLLTFQIESPHISDTVQCAIYMMRHPSACGRRVGQLLAYAAVKAGEPKLFMQLLKTMKKPVDHYILGAYAYLTNGNPPQPNHPASPNAASGSASMGSSSTTAKGVKGSAVKAAATPSAAKREEIVEELRNDTVDLMNAALSQGGQLVDREDQHLLQATFIQALRQYKKSNKKRHDMLEAALAKFGNRQIPKESPATSTAHPAASQSEEPAEKESGDAPTATGGADAEPCKAESSATTTAASTHAKASNAAESPAAHPSSRPASTTTPPAASHKGVSNAAPGSGTALNPNSLHPGFKNSPTPSPTAWEKSHSAAGTTPHSNATPAAGVTHHPSTNNSSATTSPRKQSTAASVMHHPATTNHHTSNTSIAEGGSSSGAGLTNVFTGNQNSSQSTSSHPNNNNSGSSPAGGGGEHASSITTPSKAVGPHAASTPAAASNGSHTPHAVGGTHPNSAHTHHTNSHGSPNSQSYHGDHTPSHVAPSSTHNGHPSISGTPAHTAPPPPSPHVAAYPTAVSLHSSTPTTTSSPPLPVPPLQGISTAAALATDRLPRYDPIRYHTPIQPPPLLFGGLFYLQEDNGAPLGPASSKAMAMPPLPATATTTTAAAAAVPLPAANPWAAAPPSPQPSPSAVSSMLCGLGGAAANTTGAGVFVSESLLEVGDDVWGTGGGVDTSGLEHLSSEVRKELEESWM